MHATARGERLAHGISERLAIALLDQVQLHHVLAGVQGRDDADLHRVALGELALEQHHGQRVLHEALQGALNELTDSMDRMRRQLRDIELQAETQMSSRMEAAKEAEKIIEAHKKEHAEGH